MNRLHAIAIIGSCIALTGCGASTDAPATPSRTPSSPMAMASPEPLPSVVMPTEAPAAEGESIQSPAPEPSEPIPVETRSPNEVDPAAYPSHGIDTVNGDTPMPGVEFTTDDGRIICGIFTWGHFSTLAGTVSCTVDTYRTLFPQPGLGDDGPFVQSVAADPMTGSYGLYPDWFAQPARTIPVLPAGKAIRFEGTVCAVVAGQVTCMISSTGAGFTLSPTAYTLF